MDERRRSGFKEWTRLEVALERLRETVTPVERTKTMPVSSAVGRVLSGPTLARRPVPHYDRAETDGYAVVAADTFDASDRSPVVLDLADTAGPGRAVPVDTGTPLPGGADAVVRVEETTRREGTTGDGGEGTGDGGSDTVGRIEVTAAVPAGESVGRTGEDVPEGGVVFEAGRRIRQSDPGLLRAVGVSSVDVYYRPTVGVVPTGEELVAADPAPGAVVETNGLTVAGFVKRWGGAPTYRDVVPDDRQSLRVAVERDLTKDVVVTTGGTSVGERDRLPEVVAELGEVRAHGLAVDPGHSVGFGVVRDVPVLMLPGTPVPCLVAAVQLLRPAVRQAGNLPLGPHPTTDARLAEKLASDPGMRTFAGVQLDERTGGTVATSTTTGGPGVQSSASAADGWVVVPESREGIPAGETVAVEHWEYQP